MATITENPITEIYERFKQELVDANVIPANNISFGKSDVGAILPGFPSSP